VEWEADSQDSAWDKWVLSTVGSLIRWFGQVQSYFDDVRVMQALGNPDLRTVDGADESQGVTQPGPTSWWDAPVQIACIRESCL